MVAEKSQSEYTYCFTNTALEEVIYSLI